jgi:uroporphyrin-III C-methyltransferase/precorrin-2 dehydrogenase/sirohydrochlorin ferrochelatase
VGALGEFCGQLTRHGRARSTPVAVVENASRADQRVLVGQLDNMAELAAQQAVQSPAMLVVGEVAALGTTLHWFGAPPIVADPEPASRAARALAG